jgi:hypothetical protein
LWLPATAAAKAVLFFVGQAWDGHTGWERTDEVANTGCRNSEASRGGKPTLRVNSVAVVDAQLTADATSIRVRKNCLSDWWFTWKSPLFDGLSAAS